ncbi:alpha/beta fold hydrolase [Lacisediminihabitans profunda]|uniref:Alpha/beta hydrolase n=1 Tax=Lacisediminihabitans profunda TaxID=2594790 RepID=A0A5C8UNR3_9MICO|nr:alpha/beta hydrolase [Lacisediminihabitans profunda]TXN29948.1 alpha/beta hydrolase [Lacisediminihabitans profunda]
MLTSSVESLAAGLQRTHGADVDIAFRVRGTGPAVVLLHGTSASHAVWEPISSALESSATVIALDQRGHGRSDKPATGYTGADFAGDVLTVLDALDIDTAIVGGHSLGARNAWLAGALHPERTAGVLAVEYTPWVEGDVLDTLHARVAAGNRAFASVDDVEAYLQERYPLLPTDAVARRALWGYRQHDDGLWRPLADPSAMDQLIEGFRTPWSVEFAAVSVPMIQVRGANSGIVSDAAWQAALAARPQDRFVVDPTADHYVPEENPMLVAAELRRLLSLS